jgi:tRNA A37 threonylcarbamoyladenosine biosynthesis protein TsaE
LIEWADKVPGCLPEQLLTVRIAVTGEESRQFEMEAHGSAYEEVLRSLEL